MVGLEVCVGMGVFIEGNLFVCIQDARFGVLQLWILLSCSIYPCLSLLSSLEYLLLHPELIVSLCLSHRV